jgi:hypothetical protein
VALKNAIFLDVAPCCCFWNFGLEGICRFHLRGRRNPGANESVSQLRRDWDTMSHLRSGILHCVFWLLEFRTMDKVRKPNGSLKSVTSPEVTKRNSSTAAVGLDSYTSVTLSYQGDEKVNNCEVTSKQGNNKEQEHTRYKGTNEHD